ncbi:hypothetical protein HDZ31DRAFT_32934 [Schizophyllum fasciatum]
MASGDAPVHLLSLKVMRVSRLGTLLLQFPFILGKTPLATHPKTLRDLTHAGELLMLPASFGSIQLGETFSSCLCANNDTQVDVDSVTVKVEMQTATTKVLLGEFGGPQYTLAAGDTLECLVTHEVKELGQHVLSCTVSYRLPPNARPPQPAEDPNDPQMQNFRKFYKFVVTNPLSVKTKVHTPKSPSAQLSKSERDKIFLEVHIQNLTPEPLWFERMLLDPVDGWDVEDTNLGSDEENGIFTGSTALMGPQDMRQYIYIMSPQSPPRIPVVHSPGSIIPLGRLDIAWRSSFGEPGRLLTSMLSRRIPLPPAPPPAAPPVSAVPPYLKRGATSSTPSRPSSPGPPSRPGSPAPRMRTNSVVSLTSPRPQTPPPLPTAAPPAAPDLEASLIVRRIPRDTIAVEKPFTIALTLALHAPATADASWSHRRVRAVVQHLLPPKAPPLPPPAVQPIAPMASVSELASPRIASSGLSTPTAATATQAFNYELARQKLLVASPLVGSAQEGDASEPTEGVALPPPHATEPRRDSGVMYCGPSAIYLAPMDLQLDNESVPGERLAYAEQDFELTYVPTKRGFSTVGALRVLIVEDRTVTHDAEDGGDVANQALETAKILKEWDTIAEIWV